MFSSNTAEVINFQKKDQIQDLFTTILVVHKKLKEVARFESLAKPKLKVAKLSKDNLEKVRALESLIGYSLIAYESDLQLDEDKAMILNRVSSLIDEYLSMCKLPSKEKSNKDDGFNGFFE